VNIPQQTPVVIVLLNFGRCSTFADNGWNNSMRLFFFVVFYKGKVV